MNWQSVALHRERRSHYRARWCAVALVLVGASFLSAQATPTFRVGTIVRPDTVAVGDPFTMIVTVEVPAGARVGWPVTADSNAPVAMRAPIRVEGVENGAIRRETAEYSLAAWNTGVVPIGLSEITVSVNNVESRVPLGAPTVFVQTVLPGDSSLHVPRPAKGLFARIIPWWELWWPVLVLIAILSLLMWYVWYRRHRVKKRVELDAYVRAQRDFQRLDRLALSDAGEYGRYVALALEVMRTYLSVRLPQATLALTSGELLDATTADTRVPSARLAPLLAEGDAIKFGQQIVDGARAHALATDARAVVNDVEAAEKKRQELERAQRKRDEKLKQKRKQQTEDAARRRSRQGSEAA